MIERVVSSARHPRAMAVVLLTLGGLGALAILAATRQGPGLGSDSAVYVAGAESLRAGEGLRWNMGGGESRPSNHPPLYSAVLVPFEVLGVGWENGARFLGAALFFATILGAGYAARGITGAAGLGIAAAILILATPDVLVAYSWAMTEGLYLALSALVILLAVEYLRRPSEFRVAAFGLTTCLLYLTKFGGLSVVPALVLVIVFAPGLGRGRWRHLLLYAGIVGVPFVLWSWANSILYGSVLRPLELNTIDASQVRDGLEVLIAWLLPPNRLPAFVNSVRTITLLTFVAMVAAIILVVMLATWARIRRREGLEEEIRRGWIIPAALAGSYLAAHIFAVALTLPQPDTITRTLLPIYLPLVLLAVWTISLLWRTAGRAGRGVLVAGVVVFLLARGSQSVSTVRALSDQGDGYTAWKDDGVIAALTAMPGEIVYTDDEGPVYLLAGRYARSIPFKWGNDPEIIRPTYADGLARMRTQLQSGALLVLFDLAPRMRELPPYEELTEGLVEVYSGPRGRIYAWPGSGAGSEEASG